MDRVDFKSGAQAAAGGGYNKGQDFIPSIVLAAAYLLLFPILIFRVAKKSSRTTLLVRPGLFIVVRVVTFVLRAFQSALGLDYSLEVAQKILQFLGFVFLIQPTVTILWYHTTRYDDIRKHRRAIDTLVFALQALLLVAIALGVLSGEGSQRLTDVGISIKATSIAYAVICVFVTLCVFVAGLVMQQRVALPGKPSIFLAVVSGLLLLASLYTLIFSISPNLDSATPIINKTMYYILSALAELIICILFVAFNLRDLFDVEHGTRRARTMRRRWWKKITGRGGRESSSRAGHSHAEKGRGRRTGPEHRRNTRSAHR